MGAFDDLVPVGGGEPSAFDDLIPGSRPQAGGAPPEERTWGEALNDAGLSVVQGLTGVAKLPAMALDRAIAGQ